MNEILVGWNEVNRWQIGQLSEQIKQQPRLHIDNLISQVALPQFSQYIHKANVVKLSGAIKEITLESPLVRRLYHALRTNKKIFPGQEIRYVEAQPKSIVTIDHLLEGYDTLSPAEAERGNTDLLFLLGRGEFDQFPLNSKNGTALFRFLCKGAANSSLHPHLIKLIERSLMINDREIDESCDVNIYHQDQYDRNGFDDFLQQGGNLALLLDKVPLDCREERAFNYFDCNETTIKRLSSVEVIVVLSIPEVRNYWLNSVVASLDFLEGSKLQAFAQFIDFETPMAENHAKNYLKGYLPHIVKLSFLQQVTFLEALSPGVRRKVSEMYAENQRGFADQKQVVANAMQSVMPYIADKGLERAQYKALEELKGVNLNNVRDASLDVLQQINRMFSALQVLNLWTPQPRYELGLRGLKSLLTIRLAASQSKLQEEKGLHQALSNAALDTLKYETLKEVLSSKEGDIDIDWDEYVEEFYRGVEIPQKPDEKSELFKEWQAQTRSLLLNHLSDHLSLAKTIEDVSNVFSSRKKQKLCEDYL